MKEKDLFYISTYYILLMFILKMTLVGIKADNCNIT